MKIWLCTTCGTEGPVKRETKGSFLVEIALYFCFFFPGVIYSLWRLTSKYNICRNCKSATLIPPASAVGQKLKKELQASLRA